MKKEDSDGTYIYNHNNVKAMANIPTCKGMQVKSLEKSRYLSETNLRNGTIALG